MSLFLFLFACATQTCEPLLYPGCGLLEVCVTCDSLGCGESVELLRDARSWECDGRDRNDNGVSDCYDFAYRAACPQ
jgi:hypothetical protein